MDTKPSSKEEFQSEPNLGEGTANAASYYTKFQSLQYGHKTSDPQYSDDWGELKRFILFPNHLLDLHIPTTDSMGEVVDSLELDPIARLFATQKERNVKLYVSIAIGFTLFLAVLVNFFLIKVLISDGTGLGQTFTSLTGIGATSGLVIRVLASRNNYMNQIRKWKHHTPPQWKEKNKQRIIEWYTAYLDYLYQRNIKKNLREVMMYVVARYSKRNKNMYWNNGGIDQFTTPIETLELVGDSTHFDAEARMYEEFIQTCEPYLRDAIDNLEPREREIYYLFNGILPSEIPEQKITTLSTIEQSYLDELTEQLHKRTRRISSDEVIDKWIDLLDQPDFESRTISTDDNSNQITIQELINSINESSNEIPNLIAIKGNSGLGKTTLTTQLCIHFLKSEQINISPLFIRARDIDNIKIDGSIGMKTLSKTKPYISEWLDSTEQKLLIVDGIDENMNMNQKLLDNLHKTANLHKSHVICTGRMNIEPSDYFTTYHLSDFTEDYLHQMIRRSSDNPHNRVMLNRYLPNKLKQHPLVLFGSADILTTNDGDFEYANLSFHALADLIFQRDVKESKKKYGISKPQVNLLTTIGEFALQKIIDFNHPVPENNQVFEVAEKWEMVDEYGVNETLLEGFFIMHSIGDNVESSDTFIKAWEELYVIDEERWDGFARAYLTSPNEKLPSLSEFNFGNLDNSNDVDEFIDVVIIAQQEWHRSDLVGKKRIIQRLGFDSDRNGRIKLGESHMFDGFQQSLPITRVLFWFHNRTWINDFNGWSMMYDSTWEQFADLFLNIVCPDYIREAKSLNEYMRLVDKKEKSSKMLPQFKPYWNISDINTEYLKIYPQWLGKKLFNPLLEASYAKPKTLFFRSIMRKNIIIPLDHMLRYEQKRITTLPTTLLNFLDKRISMSLELDGNQRHENLFLVYSFLIAINNGISANIFNVEIMDQRTIGLFTRLKMNVNDEKSDMILKQIYALLRGDTSQNKFDILEFENDLGYKWVEEKYIPDLDQSGDSEFIFLDKTNVNLSYSDINREKNVFNYLNSKIRGKMIPHTGEFSRNKNLLYRPGVIRERNYDSIYVEFKTVDDDNVEHRDTIFNERMYSQIPQDLLMGSRIYWLMARDKISYTWGLLPWLRQLSPNYLQLLHSDEVIQKYDSLDKLNMEFRSYGQVSSQEEASVIADEMGVDRSWKYRGVCNLRNGPDENGYFHIHIFRGSHRNNIYVTREVSGNAWEMLNQEFIRRTKSNLEANKKNRVSLIYIEFDVGFEQRDSNKHCLIVPHNMREICQSCLDHKKKMCPDFSTICLDCASELRSYPNFSGSMKKHILYVFPEATLHESDKIIQIQSDEYPKIINSIKRVLDFYMPKHERSLWQIDIIPSFPITGVQSLKIWDCLKLVYESELAGINSVHLSAGLLISVKSKKLIGQLLGEGQEKKKLLMLALETNGISTKFISINTYVTPSIYAENKSLIGDSLRATYNISQMEHIDSVYCSSDTLCIFMNENIRSKNQIVNIYKHSELESVNREKQSIRISQTVSPLNQKQMHKRAGELGIHITNPNKGIGILVGKKGVNVNKLKDILQQNGFTNELTIIFPPVIDYSGSSREKLIGCLFDSCGEHIQYISKIEVYKHELEIQITTRYGVHSRKNILDRCEDIENSLNGEFEGYKCWVNGEHRGRIKTQRLNFEWKKDEEE